MKRIIACLTAVSLCFGIASFPTFAEETDSGMVYYFSDMSGEGSLNGATTNLHASTATSFQTDEGGTDYMRFETIATQGNYSYMNLPIITNNTAVKPDVAFEIRLRNNINSNGFVTTRANTHAFLLSGTNIRRSVYNPENGMGNIGTYSYNEWNTITVVYRANEDRREIYLNGVYLADSSPGIDSSYSQPFNQWYRNGRLDLQLWFCLYSKGNCSDIDYVSIYELPESLDATVVNGNAADLNEIYIDFNMPVTLTKEMVTLSSGEAEMVELADKGNSIYRVVISEPLEIKSNYEITVNGATDIFGNTLEKTMGFTTRDKILQTGAITLSGISGEIPSYTEGPVFIEGSFDNEFDVEKIAGVVAATYDENGKMKASFIKDYTVPEEQGIPVFEETTLSAGGNKVTTMIWEGAEKPVPIGDIVNYGAEKTVYDYKNVNTAFSGNSQLGLEIITVTSGGEDEDDQITSEKLRATLTLDGADREYLTGILVKDPDGNIEYAGGTETAGGTAVYEIPLDYEKIGEYSVVCGVERGGIISDKIDYYSPLFISGKISENINSEEADAESAAEFITLLGDYMGMDVEGYDSLEDKERALNIFLGLKALEESGIFDSDEKIRNAFSTAVAMEKINEGKETAEVLSEVFELPENLKTVIDTVISSDGKQFMLDALKGSDLKTPEEVVNKAKEAAITGGVYKAENYLQVNELIIAFGDELGINLEAYNSLKSPSAVSKAVMNKLYDTTEELKNAVNKAISDRKRAEDSATTTGGGNRGGGGGGVGKVNINTSTQKTPEPEIKEEEKKISFPDVKEEDWFYADVMWAAKKGIFIGTDKGEFLPAMNLTFEHIYIVLGRMGFEYSGTAEKRDITREEFAELLYKNLCKDDNYKDAKSWIEGTGIFKGDESGNMMYDKPLTRAECCTVLRRIEK